MRKKVLFSFLSLFLLFINSCSLSLFTSKKPPHLAEVNKEKIPLERLEKKLKELNLLPRNQAEAEKLKTEILNQLLVDAIVDQKTSQLNLEEDTAFVREREDYIFGLALNKFYTDSVVNRVPDITPEEIDSFYRVNKEVYFKTPEQVKAKEILIKIKSDALMEKNSKLRKKEERKAKQRATAIYGNIKSGVNFDSLAKVHSDDPTTKTKGGSLGYVERNKFSQEFDSVAFSLPVGEVSLPFKDSRGYHLIMVVEHIDSSYVELDNRYRESIKKGLKEDRQKIRAQEFVEDMKNRHHYEFNEPVLALEDSLIPDNNWLLVIDTTDTVYAKDYKDKVGPYKSARKLPTWTIENKKELLRDFKGINIVAKKELQKGGYFATWECQEEKKKFTLQRARSKVLAKGEAKIEEPTDEEIIKYYEAHKAEYPTKELLHVYHITFDDSTKALKALNEIQNGDDFVEIAKKYYSGATEVKDQSYDLGFISLGEMPDDFYKTAKKLNPGEVGGPVKTTWGYHLIKLIEKKQEGNWQKYKVGIASALKQKQKDDFYQSWKEKLLSENKIKINQKALKKVKIEISG